MIKQFDKAGLKELNNQLKKQEKLIQKLMRQGGTIESKKTVQQSHDDFVTETVLEGASTTVDSIPAVGIARDDGRIELYTNEEENDIISIEPTSYVHETQAKTTVPSVAYRDLRGTRLTAATQKYTADYLVLYDSSGNTVGLVNVDETNNVGTAGPIAGGRDQSGAFTAETFVHFFIIYNPTTQDVSSLSSATATPAALPSGYTFYRRVGSVYFDALSHLRVCNQLDNEIFVDAAAGLVFSSQAPSLADTWESVDISTKIPATAKTVRGKVGANAGTGSKTMGVGVDDDEFMVSFFVFTAPSYGFSWNFPVLTAQTLWWRASTTDAHYYLIVTSYLDDL
jgi:hypothetical protein